MISRRQIIESQQELFDNANQQRRQLAEVGGVNYQKHKAVNDNIMMMMTKKKRLSNKKMITTTTTSSQDNFKQQQQQEMSHHQDNKRAPFRQLNNIPTASDTDNFHKFSNHHLGAPGQDQGGGYRSRSAAVSNSERQVNGGMMGLLNNNSSRRYDHNPEDEGNQVDENGEIIDGDVDGIIVDDDDDDDVGDNEDEDRPLRRGMLGMAAIASNRNNNPLHEDYRHFDPYSVYGEEDEEEDVWYSEERLYEDHLQEIVDKWLAIDDEIWAKIICMERNRRIAKAYARKHSLTVNGSEDEYLDGTTLGLNSFDNPDRDMKTRHIKQYIGQGLRINITQSGDIVVRRLSKANVFVHQLNPSDSSVHARDSNSSSDPYALNSESGDLYGVVGQFSYHRGQAPAQSNQSAAFSLASSPASGYPFNPNSRGTPNRHQFNNNNHHHHHMRRPDSGHKLAASEASSSGLASYLNGGGNGANKMPASNKMLSSSSYAEAGYSSTALEFNRPMKIFNMTEFKALLERESQRSSPNRKLLQSQCISVVSFVVDDHKMLNLPSWIMIINIVAVDLLKTELGLFGPHDLNLFGPSMMMQLDLQPPDSADTHHQPRFGYHHHHAAGGVADPLPPPLPPIKGARSRIRPDAQSQLAASKKAFANAAALGAYNGEHYATSSGGHDADLVASDRSPRTRYAAQKREPKAGAKADSDGELQLTRRNLQTAAAANGAGSNKLTGSNDKVQQSSSSSGFDSHCSSQNDSSAASSSSNIAISAAGNGFDQSRPELAAIRRKSPSKGAPYNKGSSNGRVDGAEHCEPTDGSVNKMAAQPPRGKRLPKLPHRVSPTTSVGPIPIPAPPTEPSGRANLILVSPTGLSPPLPKRKGNKLSQNKLATSCGQLSYEPQQQLEQQAAEQVAANDGICSNDSTGRVLQQQRAGNKLPRGIPAHAQLAPPATQRHILKYLLSATSGGAKWGAPNAIRQPVPPTRYQRPLPIVPSQKMSGGPNFMNSEQHEESLYYCGLQARVPNRARQPGAQPPAPSQQQHQITQSAINAILMDHHNNLQHKIKRQQQFHYMNPYLRHQHSLTNLLDTQYLHNMNYADGGNHLDHHNLAAVAAAAAGNKSNNSRPFMKLFKHSTNDNHFTKTSNNQHQVHRSKSMFSSADNLNQLNCQKSTSFLGQMSMALSRNGLKLKSSKSKK